MRAVESLITAIALGVMTGWGLGLLIDPSVGWIIGISVFMIALAYFAGSSNQDTTPTAIKYEALQDKQNNRP